MTIEPTRTSTQSAQRADTVAGDGPMVVLLQSDDDSREMYARYFQHLGWRTVQLDTGHDVFTYAPQASIVVTDILRVGEPDPYALISELKHDQRTRDVPVVVVTAWADRDCRERAEQAGCDAFLLKPCLPDDLLEVLVQLVASAGARRRTTRAGRSI